MRVAGLTSLVAPLQPKALRGSGMAPAPAAIPRPRHTPPPVRWRLSLQPQAQPSQPQGAMPLPAASPPVRGVAQPMNNPTISFFNKEVKGSYCGRNDSGVVLGGKEIREPRSYVGEEQQQFLRHVSSFFWHYAQAILAKGDAEIEAMYVNDRLVLSANNTGTMKQVYDAMLREKTFLDVMVGEHTIEDPRGSRTVNRFQNEIMSPEISSDALNLLQSLSDEKVKDAVILQAIRRSGESGAVLTDPDYEGKLILVSGLNSHAEQKLLMMLLQSSVSLATPIWIRGKKRPCFGCWLCLRFVRDVVGYKNLDFNDKPGKAWLAPISELRTFAKLCTNIDENDAEEWGKKMIALKTKKKMKTYVSQGAMDVDAEDPGHDTESDDDLGSYG
jgi:hypothetical protein